MAREAGELRRQSLDSGHGLWSDARCTANAATIERSETMAVAVHHQPVNPSKSCTLHAWIGSKSCGLPGARVAATCRFPAAGGRRPRLLPIPVLLDRRAARGSTWEPELVHPTAPADRAGRDLDLRAVRPRPLSGSGAARHRVPGRRYPDLPRDHPEPLQRRPALRLEPLRRRRLRARPSTSRRGSDPVSTFAVRLEPWMTAGFHFKLIGRDAGG